MINHTRKKAGLLARPGFSLLIAEVLRRHYVRSAWSLWRLFDVECNCLAFLKTVEIAIAGREMEEHFGAVVSSDKTEALFHFFLDCAGWHREWRKRNESI